MVKILTHLARANLYQQIAANTPAIAGVFAAILIHTTSMLVAHAQDFSYVKALIGAVMNVFEILLPITLGLAVLAFIWGMLQFIRAAGDDKTRADGRQKMVWSVLALFVAVSVWGFIGFIGSALNIGQGGRTVPPGVADEGDAPIPSSIIPPNT